MLDKNLFVSEEVHERKVTLNKQEVTLWFKEIPAVEFRKYFLIEQGDDIEKQSENMARLIAFSLCNEDGTKAITLDQAKKLKPNAMIALFKEVLEVNQQGVDEEGK
jgi:hypothetical protein